MTPRRLPRFNEVLPRQLKRRLDGFRSARHKINMIQIARRALLQKVGQVFSDLSGEERRMRVRHLVQLIFDCLNDHGMPMTQTGNSRAPRCVDIARSEEHTSELQSLKRISY